MVDFDSEELGDRLTRQLDGYVEATATNYIHGLVDNIKVEVWKSRQPQGDCRSDSPRLASTWSWLPPFAIDLAFSCLGPSRTGIS